MPTEIAQPGEARAAGTTVNVHAQGIISADCLEEVIGQISQRVQQNDTVLISTSSIAPPIERS